MRPGHAANREVLQLHLKLRREGLPNHPGTSTAALLVPARYECLDPVAWVWVQITRVDDPRDGSPVSRQ
jgi:hypothetical protein